MTVNVKHFKWRKKSIIKMIRKNNTNIYPKVANSWKDKLMKSSNSLKSLKNIWEGEGKCESWGSCSLPNLFKVYFSFFKITIQDMTAYFHTAPFIQCVKENIWKFIHGDSVCYHLDGSHKWHCKCGNNVRLLKTLDKDRWHRKSTIKMSVWGIS